MLSRLTVDRFDGRYSTESKHHLADISTDSRQCKLSTDTSPILDWRFTLPTNYRCYLDRLSVDLLTDKKTPLDQNVSRYSANTRLTSRSRVVFEVSVGQHSSQYIDQQSPKRYMILHVVIYTRFQKRYIVVSPNSKIFQYWAHTSTSEPCS